MEAKRYVFKLTGENSEFAALLATLPGDDEESRVIEHRPAAAASGFGFGLEPTLVTPR